MKKQKISKDPDAIDAPAMDDVPTIQIDPAADANSGPVSDPDAKEALPAAPDPETPADEDTAAAPVLPLARIDEETFAAFFDDSRVKKLTPLTEDEARDREALESVIRRGIDSFMETGKALVEVHGRKLFKSTHHSFKAYVVETFPFGRNQAYQIMRASAAAELVEGTDIPVATPSIKAASELGSISDLIDTSDLTAAQIENFKRDIERFALELAAEVAPKNNDGKAQLTQKLLESVKEVLLDAAKFHAVEIDGEQHHVSATAVAVTRDVFEAMQRERQRWIDNLKERQARLNTPIAAPASHRETAGGEAPTVEIRCSLHGKSDLREFKIIFGGFVLSCGCKWRRIEGEDMPSYQGNEQAPAASAK